MHKCWYSSLMFLFLALVTSSPAADLVWTNTANGNWTTAANWSPNSIPGALDSAFITNSGTYTVTVSTAVTVGNLTLGDTNATGIQTLANSGTLTVTNTYLETNAVLLLNAGTLITAGPATLLGKINQAGGTWQLNLATAASSLNQTNGDVQGRTLTVTNWNWYAGNQFRGTPGNNTFDDRTIIPAGGSMNLLGTATRYFTYHSASGPSRTLDNYGTINWTGNALLYSYGTVNNFGDVIVSAVGTPHYLWPNAGPSPIWNNYGTFTRSAGTLFRFQGVYVNNAGLMDVQQGDLSIYSSTFTNSTGVLSLSGSSRFQTEAGSSVTVSGASQIIAPTTDSIRLGGAAAYLETTNILSPSVWQQAGTLFQRTNIAVAQLNLSGGAFQLDVPAELNQLNQTNGDVQGRTLTVTNWNWYAGYQFRGTPGFNTNDDRTIIPAGGTMNLLTTATRYFTYYSGTGPSRTLDNYGTINWTGNALFYSYGTVNNYGSTIVSAVGTPHYIYPGAGPNPIWNNFGTFTRSAGTLFRFQGVYLNNSGTIDSQQGMLSLYSTVFNNNGPLTVANGTLQAYASSSTNNASMTFDATSGFSMENSGSFVFQTNSSLTVPGYNKFFLGGGDVYLRTTNIISSSAWVAGAGLYFQTDNMFATINLSLGGIQLEVPITLGQLNQTNGNVQGRNLTVTNWNWLAGYHYRGTPGLNTNDDRTIIPVGGTMNLLTTATRYFSYYSGTGPARGLDNYGTINWSGNALFYSYGTVNNYGTTTVSAVGTPQFVYPGAGLNPIWNNYGTFTRTAGTHFYFQGAYVNNTGLMEAQQGTLSMYSSVFNNFGAVNVANATFQAFASTCTNNASITLDAASFFTTDSGGTFTFETNSSLVVPAYNHLILNAGSVFLRTTNIVAPSVWVAGAGLYFQTNNPFSTINLNSGGVELDVPITLNQLNQTNGNIQGRNLTVTNWNWLAGYHYRGTPGDNSFDDRTIIPLGGTMNLLTTATRYFTYYSGTGPSRTLDNYGTINWSGNALFYSYGQFNNYGSVKVTAVGTPEYLAASASLPPSFNNYGTFTHAASSTFYFNGDYVNNFGLMEVQAGTLSSYNSTLTNYANLNLAAGAVFQSEASSVTTFTAAGQVVAPTLDSIRLGGASAYLQSTNILSPSLWLQAGTIYQQTNIVIAQLNLSGANLELSVPATLNQLNQTNGWVQGRTLTVTNWNWFAGHHVRGVPSLNDQDDRTIIPVGGTMNLLGTASRNLTYYTATGPSRTLDNYGTINWSGNALLYSYGLFNNYGLVNVTAVGTPQYIVASATLPPTFNNYGTFNRTNGTVFYFQGDYVNNFGLMNVQAGTLSIYNSTLTNSANINVAANAVFQSEAGSVIALRDASQIIAPTTDSIRLGGAAAYVETTNIVSPSLWQQAGTLYQRTNLVVASLNMSDGFLELGLPVALNRLNQTNGWVQGRTLTVTNWNWYAGHHVRGVPTLNDQDDRTIIPAGGTLNLLGTAARNLTYYTVTGPGRTLDNYGTVNWSGAAIVTSYGPFNNYGSANVSAVGAPQYFSPSTTYPSYWNNYGTFTRSAGTLFYFQGGYVNNSGLMSLQQGTVSIYNATFTNSTGQLNVGAAGVFQCEAGGVVAMNSDSQVVAPTLDSVRFGGAAAYLETTNLLTPGLWQQAGTLYQRTNIVVAKLDMSGGALQLDLPAALNQLNQTNGDIQGRTLIVTNWNWFAGNLYRGTPSLNTNDDRIIIPASGSLNLQSTAARSMSYYVGAGPGRTVDNFGAVTWSANMVLTSYGQFNNYGLVNVTAVGAPQYYSPSGTVPSYWNNFGTFTRSAGTQFYFQGGQVNNAGLLDVQQGTLSMLNSTFTNLGGGSVTLTGSALFSNDGSSTTVLEPSSAVSSTAPNAFQISGGSVYARSVNLSLPALLISGGTLYQETNVVVPIINESAGTWQLHLPASTTTYNLTNGDLRGANLTLNNFNWFGGALYASSAASNTVTVNNALRISGGTAKSLTYLTAPPGRNLINNGAATWGDASIVAQGGATFLNNGTLNVTNDTALVWGGGGTAPTLFNLGTFTKSAGTGTATYSSTAITNAGTFNYNSGSLSVGGMFVQTNGNSFLGTNFAVSSNVRIEAGTLSGKGSVAGYLYNNGTFNPGASPGWVNAGSYTNTAAATFRVELGGVGLAGTNYDQVRLAGANRLDGRIDIALVNGFVPAAGNQFTVMVHTARSGIFAITNSTIYDFTILYTSSNVVLRAENAKPALTLKVGTTQMVCQPFQFSATGNDVDGAVTNIQFFLNGSPLGSFTNAAQVNPYTAKSKVSFDFPGLSTLTAQGTDERGAVTTTNIIIQFITGPLETLTLGGFAPTTNRSFEVCMLGQLGTNYVLFANTNLTTTNWVDLGPMENTNGIWRYFDTEATNLPLRFYRAQPAP